MYTWFQIKESCEKAVLLNAKGEPRSGGGSAVSKPAPAKAPEPKPVARPKTTAKSVSTKFIVDLITVNKITVFSLWIHHHN